MSKIQWTDETWNPVTGCSHVSEGCRNCYAERMAPRLKAMGQHGYTDLPWTARNAEQNVFLHEDRLEQPLRWKKPRLVFVNSMSDLFHEQVPFSFIDRVFAAMALTPQHTYQVLTKRPERMRKYLGGPGRGLDIDRFVRWLEAADALRPGVTMSPERFASVEDGGLSNVWLGVSTEDQRAADERIAALLATPAAVRFISAEPLLGPLSLRGWLGFGALNRPDPQPGHSHIDWVICGGESGPGARPFDLAWARSLRDQCREAGVAFFLKQLGARPIDSEREPFHTPDVDVTGLPFRLSLRHSHGGDPAEWPEDLRDCRAWPARVDVGEVVPA